MVNPAEYPMNEGDMASTRGRRWTAAEYETVTSELHVAHSNALHAVFTDTQTRVLRRSARPHRSSTREP